MPFFLQFNYETVHAFKLNEEHKNQPRASALAPGANASHGSKERYAHAGTHAGNGIASSPVCFALMRFSD